MVNIKKYQNTRKGQKSKFFAKPQTDEERFGTNDRKAIIYVRVSSDGQVTQGNGLEAQERVCRDRCSKQPGVDIEVVKVFREEGVSGSLMDRKSMNEAIRFLDEENRKYSKIHYFVVTDADRIARPDDIAEAFMLEKQIESLGVKIITVNNKRDTETDEGQFMHTIQYAVAGLERKKILRRTMNGKLNSLKNGGRPFTNPPLGYTREKFSDKSYIDHIDTIKGSIIKEGLELYAYNTNFSKTQLHKFRQEKGLHTSKSTGNLYISFIEKTFRDYRLYFYAGFVYYPEWGVEQPIKGKQKALVSLEVIEKIFERENKVINKKEKSPNIDNNLELHPLKGLVTCPGCGRKPGCYASKGNGGIYYYYSCGNKYCTDRLNIPKKTMEEEFKTFIEKMKISQGLFNVFKEITLEKRKERKKTLCDSIPQLQGQIISIQSKMSKIEEKILTITNDQLSKRLEEERSDLQTAKEFIQDKIDNKRSDEYDIETTLSQIEPIFTDPVAMRENSNYDIRQLLFMVWFSGILYYKKDQGYRTNDTTGLYYLISQQGGTNDHDIPGMGLEPTNIAAFDFESNMSTNSITLAFVRIYGFSYQNQLIFEYVLYNLILRYL